MLPAYGVFRWGYLNMENVLYSFCKITFKNARESNTSQPCLHTLISTLLFTNESARSSAVGIIIFHRRASILWIILQSVQNLFLILWSADNSNFLWILALKDLRHYFIQSVIKALKFNSQSHAHISRMFHVSWCQPLVFAWGFIGSMVWLRSLCLSNSFGFQCRIVSL